MKDPIQVLKDKTAELYKLQDEVDALRTAIPLLADSVDELPLPPALPVKRWP
jgi:hypothetical protein